MSAPLSVTIVKPGGSAVILIGDADGSGAVDGVDLAVWQQHYDPIGIAVGGFGAGDFNADGKIDGGDLALWQQNYDPIGIGGMDGTETVPEPGTLALVSVGLTLAGGASRRWMRRRTAER